MLEAWSCGRGGAVPKAQSSGQGTLVVEAAECRNSKALVQEKEELVSNLQDESAQLRNENSQLKKDLEEKTKALDLLISESKSVKAQLEEANALYEDMMQRFKVSSIEQLAGQQVGVIRRSEAGYVEFGESVVPSVCKHTIHAHDGGCGSILFENNLDRRINGGQDRTVKIWDTKTGNPSSTLHGCLRSVPDLVVTYDNRSVIAASSSNNMYVWNVSSGHIRHTLMGYIDKVRTMDASKASSRNVVSATYDHTIKLWDLQKGLRQYYRLNEQLQCPFIRHGYGLTICSGHVEGVILDCGIAEQGS
ncbi:putative Autophagy-related protein 16 [Cocos nucifera]|uniref:Putative Autophagy-related protein 16 n=1 Tax=Cocos nucifera TaxID=13894 RepID=A0A8K0I1R9_COCNU|nr:putative Autophagy-related protein 16 [Cocos nucifera]